MSYLNRLLALGAALMLLSSAAAAFDAEFYVVGQPIWDPARQDTVAIFTWSHTPAYLQPTEVTVRYIVQYDNEVYPYIRPEAYTLRDFRIDAVEHSFPGTYMKGDTLECSFHVTPKTVELVGIAFDVTTERRTLYLRQGFQLDERGQVAPALGYHPPIAYGTMGLLPEYMSDTLFFSSGGCRLSDTLEEMQVEGYLSPPLRAGDTSILEYRIVPACDLDSGLYWSLDYHSCVLLFPESRDDWSGPIRAGDTMTIRFQVVPQSPGLVKFHLQAEGYTRPRNQGTDAPLFDRGMVESDWDRRRFWLAVTEDLSLLAYGCLTDPLQEKGLNFKGQHYDTAPYERAETSRLTKVQELSERKVERRRITSLRWDTERKRLSGSYRR